MLNASQLYEAWESLNKQALEADTLDPIIEKYLGANCEDVHDLCGKIIGSIMEDLYNHKDDPITNTFSGAAAGIEIGLCLAFIGLSDFNDTT